MINNKFYYTLSLHFYKIMYFLHPKARNLGLLILGFCFSDKHGKNGTD